MSVPARPRFGRARATAFTVLAFALCLTLSGATSSPALRSPALLIAGMRDIPSPPTGTPWRPAPIDANGLNMVASTDGQQFVLHTAAGPRTFLPGVDLGNTTPGHVPADVSISAAQYRAWFAAMTWLGIRVVRIYDIHPPAFYQQLAAYNQANPDRPLYVMQGVSLVGDAYIKKGNLYDAQVTDAFRRELKDAAQAVSGQLNRTTLPGRVGGEWTADITPWLAGWIIGSELDPAAATATDRKNADAKAVTGKYFRSASDATPTERWLANRMNDLAGYVAAEKVSQPIAFVNWATTDPLRHPEEPLRQEDQLQLDANHVRPTDEWPAGTFASYHAYPYYPDFLRYEPALQAQGDPYVSYLAALRKHHAGMPTMITEFGVPSSIGSAHNGPLERDQGDHSEVEATRMTAGLLRDMRAIGMAGGFVFEWADEWFRYTWNTVTHQVPNRRQLWHDPLTNEQGFGLLAMDAAGVTGEDSQTLVDADGGWPGRRVTARADESYLHLSIRLGDSPPGSLMIGFDSLAGLTGTPMAGSADRRPDAIFALNLVGHTGQAYVRKQLDPLQLDGDIPDSARGPAPDGWRPYELLVNRAQKVPIEMQNAGLLHYGDSTDSRALWHVDGDDLTIRVPWAMMAFADPSAHAVGVPKDGKLTTQRSTGVSVTLSASGTDQSLGQVTWDDWNWPVATERIKQGAEQFRDAALAVTND
ncbi:hypothetical protein Adu01nite_51620 [Paractinoplanes durhamensis]|uniref:Uncharacterized protein n=1 Tax=Paractinoplanes durhamensis TaxID=113563 RepID=A0ABQ3Z1W2_9ACTN|nr:hypothetical protein Adu01nite_51620 [Actinoplanes durhamensis]